MDFDLSLVGAWSLGAIYSQEIHPDRIVAFKNDGTGWFAESSYGVGDLTCFGWSPTSPGWVIMWPTRRFELLRGGRHRELEVVDENEDEYGHLPFQVDTETTLNFEKIEVLRLEIWTFGENVFGLLESNSANLQAPF